MHECDRAGTNNIVSGCVGDLRLERAEDAELVDNPR